MRRVLATALLLAGSACAHGTAVGAARLDYEGDALSRRQVAVLARQALQSPRDSVRRAELQLALGVALESDAYLFARTSVDVAGEGNATRLVVRVRGGEQQRLSRVRLDTSGGEDSALFAAALDLEPGDLASPLRVGEALEHALRTVVDQGYAYARLGVSTWDIDSGAVAITLSGARGPRVVISQTRIEGLTVTQPSFAERAMGRLTGLPYNRAAAEQARERLDQLGLFESVQFEGLEGEGDWRSGQLVYRVVEPRYNRFDGVVGVQGEAGTVGSARLELGNIMGTGRQTALMWQSRGRGLVDLAARYVEPLLLGLPLGASVGLEQQVQDTLYVRTRWGGRLTWAFSARERVEGGYDEERVVQEFGEVEEAQMQYTVFTIERTALDRRFAPRRGTHARISAAQIFKRERLRPFGERKSTASALELAGAWHRPLRGESGLTLELLSAGRFSSESVLQVWERYPVGGASTLRGYDEEAYRVDSYALSRLEWRWFFGRGAQRAFAFWDHAWMRTKLERQPGTYEVQTLNRDGYGVGLRIESAGGLVGIDYGLAAGRPPLEGKIHLKLISTF